MHDHDRHEQGRAEFATQFGIAESDLEGHLGGLIGAHMAREAVRANADAWSEHELSLRERSIAVVAALVAQGGVEGKLRAHLRWAVDHGCTVAELESLLVVLAVYVGYPKASTAMELLREELGAS
ncbi:MAG TPA: carboxymuconolactone decarboxylase family protein [Capillimicrobium sp.]|jgi:4-carboxymuconolactone decarboxylase